MVIMLHQFMHVYWFRRDEEGNFDTEDTKRPGQSKKIEDEEMEPLLKEDSSQTQEEVAKSLNVDRSTISRRLKAIEVIHKQGNWMSYELKPRDVKSRKMVDSREKQQKAI